MLKNDKGKEVKFGPGICIGFHQEHRLIIMFERSKPLDRIHWPNGDDKRVAPRHCETEEDFKQIVWLIADITGLEIKGKVYYSDGPAYHLA